jgi:hypothetical protein
MRMDICIGSYCIGKIGQSRSYNAQVEFFQILLVGSIPKMVSLKKFELQMSSYFDQAMFDMVWDSVLEYTKENLKN